MIEIEHKKAIEKLWSDKITAYKEEREKEWITKEAERAQEAAYQEAITEYKQRLLEENAALLNQYNPKAMSEYSKAVTRK